uniref:hypothetical protein n=1 Tax=Leyella stercorea TaxID=363265 RepID=UPI003FEFD844
MPRISRCASTDADIRNDRRRHPQRPTQTYATTDADKRKDRCRHRHIYSTDDADDLSRGDLCGRGIILKCR